MGVDGGQSIRPFAIRIDNRDDCSEDLVIPSLNILLTSTTRPVLDIVAKPNSVMSCWNIGAVSLAGTLNGDGFVGYP